MLMLIFTHMNKKNYNVIGMMSGTSLDGIDLVEVAFSFDTQWHFEIKNAETIPYTAAWREKLQHAIHLSPPELEDLDRDYSIFLADVITAFIRNHEITALDAVCTHGHTVFHQPEKGLTLQIGNTPELAKRTGHLLVCDFRTQDVALGGQGAPLVPMGDRLLFSEYGYCLNLGGFANISFDDAYGKRIAFDICPANNVLNHYVSKLGKVYDNFGEEASKGVIDPQLLDALNALEFYTLPPPKSLGIEWVERVFFPIIDARALEVRDILSTLTAHIATQISGYVEKDTKILVTGGGVHNTFLMDNLRTLTPSEIHIPEYEIATFKEALVFGLLGVLRLRNEINCLSSATGASKNHSSGKIFAP